jgi:hypothetical protein
MSLTEGLLRATLQQLQRDDTGQQRRSEKRFVGIRADSWTGPRELAVDGETFCVQLCATPLAVRAAMDTWPEHGSRLVIITPCSAHDLGCDVEARVLHNRFQPVDAWQAILGRFGAQRMAPNVPRTDWLRDLLLAIPEGQLPRLQTSSVLDRDTVRSACLQSFGIGIPMDLRSLLRWASSPSAQRLTEHAAPLRDGVCDWVEESLGMAGRAIVRTVLAGKGSQAIATGLVVRSLVDTRSPTSSKADATTIAKAEGKLEAMLGGQTVVAAQLQSWADAAEELLLTELAQSKGKALDILETADQLLDQLGARSLASTSDFLREGQNQRELALAEALRNALSGANPGLNEVDRCAKHLLHHVLLRDERRSKSQAIAMACRLLRWLGADATTEPDFYSLATKYARDLSYVDQARETLDYPGPLQVVLRELWRTVSDRREAFNQRFAEALVHHTAATGPSPQWIPLEDVLDAVVAPIAQKSRVLLVVLDGMSLPVFHEILSGFVGWTEVGQGSEERVGLRRYGIAALPTVTEVSRTSLFCGKITTGNQTTEKSAFAAHPALRVGKRPPVLFHKDDLTDARIGLAESVIQAITGSRAHDIVGVVVNAIDDWLGKGDQDAAPWTVERIKPLVELLECAASDGRTVVITSDHGHVREHATSMLPGDGGTRYRSASTLRAGEVRLRGPRVAVMDGEIAAPWTESVRYAPSKQNGYHGGATPQEVVVPLSVFVRTGTELDGFDPVPFQQPAWWDGTDAMAQFPREVGLPKQPSPKRTPQPTSEGLPFRGKRRDLIESLLASTLYAAQAEAAGKMRVDDQRVRSILLALAERGDSLTETALAAKLQLPLPRVTGSLTGLRRTLNLDGVEAIEIDAASRTVRVNWNILARQFGLEEAQP